MSLEITDAIKKELRPVGRQKKMMYLFKCSTPECLNEVWVEPRNLIKRQGCCRTCSSRGLMQKILPGSRGAKKRPYEWLLHRVSHAAASRGIFCDLAYEEFLSFTTITECHYCGSKVTWTAHNMGKGNVRSNLDRLDNSLGYTKENLVVSCIICNRIKNNYLSYEDMMELSPVLRRILPTKNWVETHKKKRFGHHLQGGVV